MLPEEFVSDLKPLVRTAQVIVLALVAGCLIFLGIILFVIGPVQANPANQLPGGISLTAILLGITLPVLVARWLVPGLAISAQVRKIAQGKQDPLNVSSGTQPAYAIRLLQEHGDAGRLALVYQTKIVLGAALLEGPTMLALVAYFLERQPIALSAALALVGVQLWLLPTLARAMAWISAQLQFLSEQRQFGGA